MPKPQPIKALLVTTTTTVVAPQHTSAILMLRSPMLGALAMGAGRWPSGSEVQTADDLHLTLCYLGEAAALEPRQAAVAAVVQAMAAQLPPLLAVVSGIGRFTGQDGMDAVYASIDCPDLARWLVRLQEGLEAAGFPCDQRHGHDPHVTLAYVPSGVAIDLPAPWPLNVAFTAITLGWAMEATDYALGGPIFNTPADVTEAAAAGAAAAGEAAVTEAVPEDEATAGDLTTLAADDPAKVGAPAIWLRAGYTPQRLERKNDPAGRQWKTLPHHVKDISGRTVVGIFSVFGNLDSYDDVCMPGSFAKTFRERAGQIHHIWQHDTGNPPIAVIDQLQEVGRDALPLDVQAAYPEATGGAEVRRTYLEGPELANWVFEAIGKGAPLQMSYMYDPLRFEILEQDGQRVRLIYEQRLWETSDVLWGANSATRASKALGQAPPMPVDLLAGELERLLVRAQKAGARHSAEDTRALNQIHTLAVQLGCTTCKGMTDAEEEAAAAPGTRAHVSTAPSLADLRSSLDFLIFINQES